VRFRLELSAAASPTLTLEGARSAAGRERELSLAFLLRNVTAGLLVHRLAHPAAGAAFPSRRRRTPTPMPHMFPGPLQFDAPQAALRFDAQYLKLPLRPRREGAGADAAARAVDHGAAVPARPPAGAAGAAGAGRAPERSHSAEALAELLHVSARTLHGS
jgi:hypothetical protein